MPSALNYDGGLTCAIKVTELDRSIRWYQDVLGFTLLYRVEEIAWCELATETKGVNIGLSQVERAGGPGGAILTFGVTDIDAARQQLASRNVRFDGPTQTIPGMVRLATFYDPDGNALMFYQDLQKK